MSNEQVPSWLSQVQQLTTDVAPGQSETGAALAALAALMQPVAPGSRVGAVARRADGSQVHALVTSSGDLAQDAVRVAREVGVPADAVSLLAADKLVELLGAEGAGSFIQIP